MNEQFTLRAIVITLALGTTIIGIGVTPVLTIPILAATTQTSSQQNANSENNHQPLAPIATSGDNIYIVWRDKKTGNNNDVFFRASTDGGKAFGDKINLRYSTK